MSYKKVVVTSRYLHVLQRTMRFLRQSRAFVWKTTLTDVFCSGWSVFYGAGLCRSGQLSVKWTHLSPLSFAASNHCQGGSSARQTSAQNKRQMIFLFCFVLMGHMALPQRGVFDLMLESFFHDSMWFCCVYVCQTEEKMWGSDVLVMFFSKTGQFNDTFAKTSPSEYLIWPFILPLFAWCKLSPKLKWLWFSWFPAMYCCMCYVLRPPFQFVFDIFYGVTRPTKGFF